MDKRKLVFISLSLKNYLNDHIKKLRNNWYMTSRGEIESYAMTPTDPGAFGSITKTNGFVITAHAYFNYTISRYSSASDPNQDDLYHFSYQIKINDDPDYILPIFPAILKTRTWFMNGTEVVTNKPGVICCGTFPKIEKGMETFIYES